MQINFEKVNFTYNKKTPYENNVLKNINLEIKERSFTAIIGKTGSGKSTLIEHINGLLIAEQGYVKVADLVIDTKKSRSEKKQQASDLQKLRENVAMLFQFSEAQLFEQTVLKDIIFAPMNYGVSEEEAIKIAKELIKIVGLDESYLERSPFELSGGEMRKVALCGVLAQKPKILVLDEATIGLDFKSKCEFMKLIEKIYREQKLTIVFITHNMDYVLEYATDIVVMQNGEIVLKTNNKESFLEEISSESYNLSYPEIIKFQQSLKEQGLILSQIHYNYESLLAELTERLRKDYE